MGEKFPTFFFSIYKASLQDSWFFPPSIRGTPTKKERALSGCPTSTGLGRKSRDNGGIRALRALRPGSTGPVATHPEGLRQTWTCSVGELFSFSPMTDAGQLVSFPLPFSLVSCTIPFFLPAAHKDRNPPQTLDLRLRAPPPESLAGSAFSQLFLLPVLPSLVPLVNLGEQAFLPHHQAVTGCRLSLARGHKCWQGASSA